MLPFVLHAGRGAPVGAGKKGQVHILKNNRHYWQGTRRAGTSSCPPWSPQASCDCRKEKLGVHVDRLLHLTNFGTPLQNACTPGVTTSLKRYSVPQAASLRRPAAGPRHRVAPTAPIAQPIPQTAPPLILYPIRVHVAESPPSEALVIATQHLM